MTDELAQADRIAELKRQIAAGTYETEARLSAAVDALLDDLNAGKLRGDTGKLQGGDNRQPRPRQPR